MLSVEQLRKPTTRTQSLAWILELLKSLGFETTGWQDGRIQKAIASTLAILFSDDTELAKTTVEFGFNDYATGDPLNEFSKSRFGNQKTEAVRTRGPLTLTSTATIPYTIQPGQLIASTKSGIQFRNVNSTPAVLSAGSPAAPESITVEFEALLAGSQGNVGTGEIDRLVTALAGVTVTNAGDPWYTTAGADEESDASIRRRNETKWSRLSLEHIGEWYESVAREFGAAKVALGDDNPRGPGTIDVYCAGELDELGNDDMQVIQTAFHKRTFGTDETWIEDWSSSTSTVAAKKAPKNELDLNVTIYHDAGLATDDVRTRVEQALRDYLRRTPLGGWSYPPGLLNVVTLGDLSEVIEGVEGVQTATIITPASNLSIDPTAQVVEGDWSGLTFVAVTT